MTKPRKFHAAQAAFDTAVVATSKPGFAPMYREFVSSEYAKLLTRIGKKKKAKEAISETKSSMTVALKRSQH
jgi:hypothetical protein